MPILQQLNMQIHSAEFFLQSNGQQYKVNFVFDVEFDHYYIILSVLVEPRGWKALTGTPYSGEDISSRSAAIAVKDYEQKK